MIIVAGGAGIYLGFYFNVWVLLPTLIPAVGASIISSWASEQNFVDEASVLWVLLISVQAGFMFGLTAREIYGQFFARLNIGQSTSS
jgi:hypothetical protein